MVSVLTHFVSGKRVPGSGERFADVFNPSTGAVTRQVPLATATEVDAAVADAVAAQRDWARWNPQRRARVLLKFLHLVDASMNIADDDEPSRAIGTVDSL